MKKLIKYVVSFLFVFLLFPVSVIAGELQESKTYEAKCSSKSWFGDEMVIYPTKIVGSIVLKNFDPTGQLGVEAMVVGNGNQAIFSGSFNYKKIGDRLELPDQPLNIIPTNVTKDQFQEHFGLFPTITCTAG